jgi:hypothetical protein
VWLATPPEEWRERYRGWKALEKEYVDCLMRESAGNTGGQAGTPVSEASKLRKTLARHYAGGASCMPRIFRTSMTRTCGPFSETASGRRGAAVMQKVAR